MKSSNLTRNLTSKRPVLLASETTGMNNVAAGHVVLLIVLGLLLFSCQTIRSSSSPSKVELDIRAMEPGYTYKFQEKVLAYPDAQLFFFETVRKTETALVIDHADARGTLLDSEEHKIIDGAIQANGVITVYRDSKVFQIIELVYKNGKTSYVEKVDSQKMESLVNTYGVTIVTSEYYELDSSLFFKYKDGTFQNQSSRIRNYFFTNVGDVSKRTYSANGNLASTAFLMEKKKDD